MNERSVGLGTVGVVIPTYNAEAWIDQTLASVAAQQRQPDQVVLVDDASTDSTVARAQGWCDRLPLRVIELTSNGGAGRARARGIASLRTSLVSLLDADDYWFPDHLAHLSELQRQRGGMVCPLSLDWWPGTRLRPHKWRVPQRGDQLAKLVERCWVFSGGIFARRDYDASGGFRHRPLVEDWDLWLRMAVVGVHFSEGRVPTVLYRRHTGNVTGQPMQVLEAAHRLISEHAASGSLPANAVRRSLRSTEAEMALQHGADLFTSGHPWRARKVMLGGLRGRPKLMIGSLAALTAPMPLAQRLARRGYHVEVAEDGTG